MLEFINSKHEGALKICGREDINAGGTVWGLEATSKVK